MNTNRQNDTAEVVGDMPTPWGLSQQKYKLAHGVIWVSTAGHGGLLVGRGVARTCLTERAQREGEPFGPWLAYEEDCAYAIALYENPAWANEFDKLACGGHGNKPLDAIRAEMREVIDHWFPHLKQAQA